MFGKVKVTTKIMLGLLVPMLLLVLIFGLVFVLRFRHMSEVQTRRIYQEQRDAITEKLKGQVDIAMTIVERTYYAAGDGADEAEVKADALEYISNLRFGPKDLDYIWVHQYNPDDIEQTRMLMHPTMPELNGTDISDYRDMERFSKIYYLGQIYDNDDPRLGVIEHTNLFVAMNEVCRDYGGGIVDYYWPKPGEQGVSTAGYQKMSYVEEFRPWNWVIGTGAYVEYIDQIVAAEKLQAKEDERGLYFSILVAMLAAILTGLPVSIWISRKLSDAYRQLEEQLRRNEAISNELAASNAELTQALAEVKVLSGLLPICSYCKQIRDDEGYWNQMESYIGERSDAQFSHGICPKCAKEHYPEYDLYPEEQTTDN